MGVLAGGGPLLNPLHLGCVDSCIHIDQAVQLIANFLGPLFDGQGQVLYSHLDFAAELFACCLELKVVLADCIA